MSSLAELKQAVAQLEVDHIEFQSAKKELDNWHDYDMRRSDGSTRQDALHEEIGRNAKERVWHANRKFEAQKELISRLIKEL